MLYYFDTGKSSSASARRTANSWLDDGRSQSPAKQELLFIFNGAGDPRWWDEPLAGMVRALGPALSRIVWSAVSSVVVVPPGSCCLLTEVAELENNRAEP